MGHRLSKTSVAVTNNNNNNYNNIPPTTYSTISNSYIYQHQQQPPQPQFTFFPNHTKQHNQLQGEGTYTNNSATAISIPTTLVNGCPTTAINLQIEESPNGGGGGGRGGATAENVSSSECSSLNSIGRQIIIKIQLAKMENGNAGVVGAAGATEKEERQLVTAVAAAAADLNVNSMENATAQLLNLTLNATAKSSPQQQRTAGSSRASTPPPAEQSMNKMNLNENENSVAPTAAAVASSITHGGSSEHAMPDLNKRFNVLDDVGYDIAENGIDDVVVVVSNADANNVHHEYAEESGVDDDDEAEEAANDSVEYCEVLELVQPIAATATATAITTMTTSRNDDTSRAAAVIEMSSSRAEQHACASEVNATSNRGKSCCRSNQSKSSNSSAANSSMSSNGSGGSNSSSGSNSKRRCCKCKYRDALRGIRDMLDSSKSSSKSNKQLQQQQQERERKRERDCKQSQTSVLERHMKSHAEHRRSTPAQLMQNTTSAINNNNSSSCKQRAQLKRNSIAFSSMSGVNGNGSAAATASTSHAAAREASTSPPHSQQVEIWTPGMSVVGDVIIRITAPQFMVGQQQQQLNGAGSSTSTSSSLLTTPTRQSAAAATTVHVMAAAAPTVSAAGIQPPMLEQQLAAVIQPVATSTPTLSTTTTTVVRTRQQGGVVVHSQIDFVHYLVPDLERIINSSFYWGKMDRYEAERLLDGKPEGTFLLRDSAQDEFLFSVTFRKYGRSLHARIEQSGHKFSFDCHDPNVFTAPTVTGLLEHYKDPSCVMFFEPMLTIPLHRKTTFSLQQLCRATIVSNTTYDGINQLELPMRLKCYLKEYHYKQQLRFKPFDEAYGHM